MRRLEKRLVVRKYIVECEFSYLGSLLGSSCAPDLVSPSEPKKYILRMSHHLTWRTALFLMFSPTIYYCCVEAERSVQARR